MISQTKIKYDKTMVMKKTCGTCRNSKSVISFSRDRSTKDGLDMHCRECKKNTLQELIRNYPAVKVDLTASKYCYLCKKNKKVSDFYRNKYKRCGVSTECRNCSKAKNKIRYNKNRSKYLVDMKANYQKNKHIISAQSKILRKTNPEYFKNLKLREFGITLNEYNEMSLKQKHVCAICKSPETIVDNRTRKPRALAVDHCHQTKVVRGLLCMGCNQGLGNFREDISRFKSATKYLNKFKGNECPKT